MTTLTWYADGGTNGNTIATSDTGSGQAFSAVSLGTGTTAKYSNSGGCLRPGHSLCYAWTVSGTSAAVSCRWTSALINPGGNTNVQYYGFYLDPADFTAGVTHVILRGTDTTVATTRYRVVKDSTHKIILQNSSNTAVLTSTALSSGTRYRVAVEVVGTTTGACRLKVYAGDSGSTFYDSGAGTTGNFGGIIQAALWGQSAATTSVAGKVTDLSYSDTAEAGPSTVSADSGALSITDTVTGTPKIVVNASGAISIVDTLTGTPRVVVHASGALAVTDTLTGAPRAVVHSGSDSVSADVVLAGVPVAVVHADGTFTVAAAVTGVPSVVAVAEMAALAFLAALTGTADVVTHAGSLVIRPNTGLVTRPDTGTVTRPNTGTVTRP